MLVICSGMIILLCQFYCSSSSHSSQTQELEKEIRNLLRSKSVLDKSVQQLRSKYGWQKYMLMRLLTFVFRLRELYEQILFADLLFAATKVCIISFNACVVSQYIFLIRNLLQDIEQQLWKNVFYKVIEEFRRRIRKYNSSIQKPDEQTPQTIKDDLYKVFF